MRALAARLFRDVPRRDKIPAWVQGSEQMKFTMMVLSLGASLGGSAAWADPPKPLRATGSVEIKAPTDEAWRTVRDFKIRTNWHPASVSTDWSSGGTARAVGWG